MVRTILLTLTLLLPTSAVALENAGIVDGIWFSKPTLVEQQPTRIYVAIHNTTDGDLEGTVHFRVNDELLDTMRINALSGRIIESWADWIPPAGTSTVQVNLRRTELVSTASGTQNIAVVQPLTERTVYIDTDTDQDGIGDRTDPDDDNDGRSDEEETAAGTDPLTYDAPPPPPPATTTASATESEARHSPTANQGAQAGLEALVEPGTTQNVLQRSTEAIKAGKRAIDTYRSERARRASSSPAEETGSVRKTAYTIGNTLYGTTLALLSWLFGYPGLVQLLVLVSLLYLSYRLARYYGRRPE